MKTRGSKEDSSLFFTDGVVARRHAVLVAGGFNAAPDSDASRLAFFLDGEGSHYDVSGDSIRSVTFNPATQLTHFLGRHGRVVTVGNGKPISDENLTGFREADITGPKRYGELFRIRAIGGEVFACGQSSQIYRLGKSGWAHFDRGLLHQNGATLLDIDGTAPDRLFAVGFNGTLVRFDGRSWRRMESPTPHHLLNVRCAGPDTLYVSGYAGTVFRLEKGKWHSLGLKDVDEAYWGLELFGGSVYVAHSRGLRRFDGEGLQPVAIKVRGRRRTKFTFHRLHAADGMLMSFGEDHLLGFDGKEWIELRWPDNR